MYVRIGARIKKAREERYLSQAELGRKIGVTATAINYYEKGKRKISIDDLFRLASVLAKQLNYFLSEGDGHKDDNTRSLPVRDLEPDRDLFGITVMGTVRAGEPVLAEQNVLGYLPFPRELSKEVSFALRVKGDSMAGEGIDEGDLVLIRRQSYVDFNGQIVCALVNGEESTLKIFLIENGKIHLRAANPDYPDIILSDERELTIQGVYAGVFKFPAGPKAASSICDNHVQRLPELPED